MSDPSDWEPLPTQHLAAHPGEFAELGKRTPPASPPAAVAAATPAAAPAPSARKAPDPAAERALAGLKAKLAQAPPASSLVAEVCRREAKAQRKRRAAAAAVRVDVAPAPAAPLPAAPAEPPLDVAFATGIDGRDPREDETWFLELPAAEQERLRGAWALRREQVVAEKPCQRRNKNRRFVASMVVFAAVWAAGTGTWWHATFGAGIGCGIWWRNTTACRFRDPSIAFCCFLVANLLAWWGSGSESMPPGLASDVLLLVALAALVGFDGEIRRTGGFDAI